MSAWAMEFVHENDGCEDWRWNERMLDNGMVEMVGVSGTKYARFEVMPISREQGKDRAIKNIEALEKQNANLPLPV